MALPHIILTYLKDDQMTGYDISKSLTQTFSVFWRASHQQIYRELNKLEKKNFVSCVLFPQSGKPDRKVYSITNMGRMQLSDWLDEEFKMPILRDEMTSKMFTADKDNISGVIEDIKYLMEECRSNLDRVEGIRDALIGHILVEDLDIDTKLKMAAFNKVSAHYQSQLDWAHSTLGILA
ncbi:hypothetical protein A134_23275 [Vibrio crassostreae 9CS106]|uniref:Transcriptional regulator n=1 Tax=Vibrio crassostreae 9CS106 TaxID=1191300 RepID=A0A1B1C3A8_9VIBR|nr:hypothetical protein A134_23275 [Vibrio crassostreae 9CS106]